jgi:diaminopimelate decarboxylase
VEPFWKALDEILAVARQLAAEGIAVEVLDLGGGYGISYGAEPPLDVERLARGLEERLRAASMRLILEPGRALVGNAGALLTRVLYVKRNQRKNFVVVDAGMNDLMRPTLYGSYHEIVPARGGAAERLQADIVGPLCESGDFFARDRDMPDVQPGDLLAVLTVGAYGFVLSSNYNTRPRPAEVLVHGAEAELIRARETLESLMAGEKP